MKIVITGGIIIGKRGTLQGFDVVIEDGTIYDICQPQIWAEAVTYDVEGAYIMPGILDINTGVPQGFSQRELVMWGVTASFNLAQSRVRKLKNTKLIPVKEIYENIFSVKSQMENSVVVSDGCPQNLLQSIFFLHSACGMDLCEAVAMYTTHPAKAAGVHKELGSVEKGKRADLLILRKDYWNRPQIEKVFIKGNCIFQYEMPQKNRTIVM